MNMNAENNKSTSAEYSQTRKNSSESINDGELFVIQKANKENIIKNVNEVNISNTNVKNRHGKCWSKLCYYLPFYLFAIFISLSITVGVVTVYSTSPKHINETCQPTFKPSAERLITHDARTRHAAVGDLNNDGYLDIAVVNSGTDSIGIFMGHGNGMFASQITQSTGLNSRPYSVAVGNFNNDSLLDIAIANYDTHSVGVIFGYGNGSFIESPIVTLLGASRPLSLATGHFNNDSFLDMAVVNYGTMNVIILLGYNDGSFRIEHIFYMGHDSIPYSLTIADFNDDQHSDIAIVNYGTSELIVLLSSENQTWINYTYSTGKTSQPMSISFGHFNNDTKLDIVVSNSGTSDIGIFYGHGDGSFINMNTFSTGTGSRPRFVQVADFDNDTRVEIVVVDPEYDNVIVLKGDRYGNFSIITTHSTGYNSDPCAIVTGDFDNDNIPDIAITNNYTNNILILTSFYRFPQTTQTMYSTGSSSNPNAVDINDLNHDNYLDIVVANAGSNTISIFLNQGNGSFYEQKTYYMGSSTRPIFVATGDFNNDKHIDIVVVLFNSNRIQILLGYGNGTFRNGESYSTGSSASSYTAFVSDINNDKNVDIIVSNYNSGNVGLFIGYGNGTYKPMVKLLSGYSFYPKCASVADINNDSIMDIIASDSYTGGIAILLGYGNTTFQAPKMISTNRDLPNCFSIGDINNDQQLDIVYTDTLYSHLGILLGNGNGTFTQLVQYLTNRGSKPWFLDFGYYNNDNFIDILVSNSYDASITIFLGNTNGTFNTQVAFPTGYQSIPWSVKFADFNNDNQEDIVVGNDGTNNILIFLVHYEEDFRNETSYSTGSASHPYSISVGDLNKNGKQDIVVTNTGSDSFEILLDYENGKFMERILFSVDEGSHPQDVIIADFNKDNLSDIAVVNFWGNNVHVFLGFINGSFQSKTTYSTGSKSLPNSIAAGDFNKDNRTDIVVVNYGIDSIAVFLASVFSTFKNYLVLVPGYLPSPLNVIAADFNNDGQLDMAVTSNYIYNLEIYLGYGNGTFSDSMSYYTGYYSEPYELAAGDFNNDNYLDIVVANSGSNNIGIFFGYGNGTFQSQKTFSTGSSSNPRSVAIGDFNNDKNLDIAVGNYYSSNIYLFLGNGNGSFAGKVVFSTYYYYSINSLAVGDANNDGILDIFVPDYYYDQVNILLGYGNGSFQKPIILSTGYYSRPFLIALGDFNEDKLLDIVIANYQTSTTVIIINYGNNTFLLRNTYLATSRSEFASLVVADMNNDAILDILVTDYDSQNSSIAIYYGYGDGNFTLPKLYPAAVNSQPVSLTTGDFNNDNKSDFAVVYYNHQSVSVRLQDDNEPFGTPEIISTGNGSASQSVVVDDLNNDGHLDIVVTNTNSDNIGIFLGFGNGSFNKQLTYSTGNDSQPTSIAIGDLNNDDYIDIVIINSNNYNVGIFFGYGNGTFDNMIIYSLDISSDLSSIAVEDLNKDNYLDLIIANWGNNNIHVAFGLGNGTFGNSKLYSVGYNSRPLGLAITDIDNNDLMDIIVANYDADYVEILLQKC